MASERSIKIWGSNGFDPAVPEGNVLKAAEGEFEKIMGRKPDSRKELLDVMLTARPKDE